MEIPRSGGRNVKPSGTENSVGGQTGKNPPWRGRGGLWKFSGSSQISVSRSESTSGVMLLSWRLQITFFQFWWSEIICGFESIRYNSEWRWNAKLDMDNSIVKKKFSITKFWVLHVTQVQNVRAEKMTSETRFPLGNKQSIISGN